MKKKFLILISLLLLCSCNTSSSYCEERQIDVIEMFNKPHVNYYVFFYLDKCLACRDVKLRLTSYCGSLEIYYIDFMTCLDSIKLESDANLGKTKLEEISINQVPLVLEIKEKMVVNEYLGSSQIFDFLSLVSSN